MASQEELHARSLADPDGFWAEAAAAIEWFHPFERVRDDARAPFVRWFPGGVTSTCHNALDRHVAAGRGAQPALVWDSAMTGAVRVLSYAELLDETARLAGALAGLGVHRGDRVLVYMPMVPEAVVAMLACARLGAVHSVVFGGFAARELAARIDDARPKLLLTASCGLEPSRTLAYAPLVEGALERAASPPARVVVLQRPELRWPLRPGRDLDWRELVAGATPAGCVPVAATDPLYVLYTSGTTGKPKGVVRDHGGHAVALAWSLRHVYGMRPGETFWAASDVGWVVGHSYIVYAPLLLGCTTILFEGKPVGTPDAGAFWRVAAQHGVDTLFAAPTAIRAIKREDPEGARVDRVALPRLRALFLAGERADPDTVEWAGRILGVPVIDHWWQTETGWPVAANCLGLAPLPVKPGSPTKPVPGFDVRVLDDAGAELPPGAAGHIALRLPLPPGCLPTLWNDDDGFVRSYLERFPGHYATGDGGYFDADGYLWVMGRTDDVINVAGHRLSTGAMEEVLARHPDVAECAVIGVADALKGQLPLGLAVLKATALGRPPADVERELVEAVRREIGPVASLRQVLVVPRLPKTRSGKVLRGTMRRIADAGPWSAPATIDDPAVLDEIRAALHGAGYARDDGPHADAGGPAGDATRS
ncbi:MAG: AMP-binding protein [Deltaproteobacteria bacterium]|nr:AMP-binding protein [Deltaproteobacteria bacterium]